MQAASPTATATRVAVRGTRVVPATSGARVLRTARHLSLAQLAARARFMLLRRVYALQPELPIQAARHAAAGTHAAEPLPALPCELIGVDGATGLEARAAALARGRFAYVGREADYSGGIQWHDPHASPLWAFNLHYLGSVLDLALTGRAAVAREILASWTEAFGARWDSVAWHPYPAS